MLRTALLSLCLLGSSLGAQPAPTPAQRELAQPIQLEDGKTTPNAPTEPGPSGFQAFGSLLVVLGLAGASLWALKKYGRKHLPGSGGEKLKVAETLALGDRRFVSILEAEGERFLIALHPQGISLLARLDGLENTPAGAFQDQVAQAVELTRPVPVKEMEARLKQEEIL
ncbi:MAG TPA: flagellar biosynthetic protein FliO [Holophagaceae bacterium]|nr:flagellar biosynthetic protein FliO [Holophagaceae bacterium]